MQDRKLFLKVTNFCAEICFVVFNERLMLGTNPGRTVCLSVLIITDRQTVALTAVGPKQDLLRSHNLKSQSHKIATKCQINN